MSPRTAALNSPRTAGVTRSTRSTRNSAATELLPESQTPSPPQRSAKSTVTVPRSTKRRITRTSRAHGTSDEDEAAESGTDADKEDDNNDDADEPEVMAPSEVVTRQRRHQTGLSLSLQNTTLDHLPRGTKRELSTSTQSTEARPSKAPKQESVNGNSVKPIGNDANDEDDDDDDAYNAVDDISESDDNPSDVERVEEREIIASEEKRSKRGASVDSWAGFTLDGIAVDDESPFFSENFAVTEPNSEIDLTSVDQRPLDKPPQSPRSAPTRRVRFADVESTSSSSGGLSQDSEIDEAAFPDLILDQENLHPTTRQLFDIDEDETKQHSDDSFWEFDPSRDMPPPKAKERKPVEESTDDFSGYESDSSSGQTTDEESVPPLTVHRPHTVLRLNAEARNKVDPRRRSGQRTPIKPGSGPCMGTWIADPSKPIGVIHPRTKRMVYLAPRVPGTSRTNVRPTSSADSSPPQTYIDTMPKLWARSTWPGPSPRKSSESDSSNVAGDFADQPTDFVTRSLADAMMNGLHANGSVLPYSASDGFFAVENEVDDPDGEDPDEAKLDIEAFIDFGEQDSDSPDGEPDAEMDALTSPVTPLSMQRLPTITPKRSRGRSSSQNLLEHFDKGVVSAFRRNQTRHQAVLRRPVTGNGRVQAIKGGHHGAAEVPISPIRKRKTGRSLSSSMAPFTGINTTRLRSGTF